MSLLEFRDEISRLQEVTGNLYRRLQKLIHGYDSYVWIGPFELLFLCVAFDSSLLLETLLWEVLIFKRVYEILLSDIRKKWN